MIEILQAAPFQSIQDAGRVGGRNLGIPGSGAMDLPSLQTTNLIVGNPPRAAGIEWALGPMTLGFPNGGTIAVGGAEVVTTLAGATLPMWTAAEVAPGGTLLLSVPRAGRFGYLAVSGGIAVPVVMGSRATYFPAGFGGLDGRLLRAGDRVPIGLAPDTPPRLGTPLPPLLRPAEKPIRVLAGPQDRFFDESVWEALEAGHYRIATAADRMGYRLEGAVVHHSGPATLPSEAACPGAIQVPQGGTPIVVMRDGPTVGGYPKLGVIIGPDLGRFAQLSPGDQAFLYRVDLTAALEAARWEEQRLRDGYRWTI